MKHRIVLVPFPFDDLSSKKLRPALILTEPVGDHRHVVLAFITSRTPDILLETDIELKTDSKDFAETGLRVASTIRLHRLMTVSTNIIQRELGVSPVSVNTEITDKLRKFFEI